MAALGPFELTTYRIGALPLIDHVLERLRIEPLLNQYVPTKSRRTLVPYATALGVVLRNILVGRHPLYGLREWAQGYDPEVLGMDESTVESLNDDRVGRALEKLFDADRASLLTAVVLRAVREYEIDLDRFHNDSTSLTFAGQYARADGRKIRGKKAAAIRHGHNKDHRPDLKQLLWILTVSADGTVPVHYRVCDGNTPDDPTHIDTWEAIRQIAGRSDFLYVADCKLCSRANMDHIAGQQGRFLTVLPRSRKEDSWFREYLQTHEPAWTEAVRRPSPRHSGGLDDVWYVFEAPLPSAEGYRIIWVWSVLLAQKHQQTRFGKLKKAFDRIEALDRRLQSKHCRFKERSAVHDEIDTILRGAGVKRWVEVDVIEDIESSFKQAGPGRPGRNTKYKREDRIRFRLQWETKADVVAYDAKSDGIYPLITNDPDLPAAEVLAIYKEQPRLEKRHEQLKTVYEVMPAFLKDEGRIEALLFLYFLAMLVQALVERQVRRGMEAEGIKNLPMYPEDRACAAPTADRIFELFEPLQRHELRRDGVVEQDFGLQLTPLQQHIMQLMGAPKALYDGFG